jgi:enterochelin esterase-like enzyme
MKFINYPETAPENITHRTFFSKLYQKELGVNIYLPPDYSCSGIRYPVSYHLHGWTGNESSEIWAMEKVCKSKNGITVFPNSSPVIEDIENLPVENMLINELIPLIDREYRTLPQREDRSISGFSMGGGFAFYCAVKYPEIFSAVTAYAGTYHHYYHKGSRTVGVAPEKAAGLYDDMMKEERYLEEGNILCLINSNADKIRGNLDINIRIGSADVLFCDNEILHLFLTALNIPHQYKVVEGIEHELLKII